MLLFLPGVYRRVPCQWISGCGGAGYEPYCIGHIERCHHGAFPALYLEARVGEEPKQYYGEHHDGEVGRREALYGHGADEAGEAEYHEDVEDVGAHDVADGYAAVALARGHEACGQFGQRCAAGHYGEADDGVAHSEGAGHGGGMAHEDVTAYDEARQSAHDQQYGFHDLHWLGGRRVIVAVAGALDGDVHEKGEAQGEQQRVEARDDPVEAEHDEHGRGCHGEGDVALYGARCDGDRRHHRGKARDEQHIERVGTDHVAHRHARAVPERGDERYEKLGHRCAHSHHREPDDQLRHACARGDARRTVGEQPGAPEDERDARNNK